MGITNTPKYKKGENSSHAEKGMVYIQLWLELMSIVKWRVHPIYIHAEYTDSPIKPWGAQNIKGFIVTPMKF